MLLILAILGAYSSRRLDILAGRHFFLLRKYRRDGMIIITSPNAPAKFNSKLLLSAHAYLSHCLKARHAIFADRLRFDAALMQEAF